MLGILTAIIVVVSLYIYKYYENVKRYPRGPTPLPFIGNLFQFDAHRLHVYLEKCQAEYGDVFTVWTPCPMVVLMSYEKIKAALVTKGDDFLGRMGRFPDDVFQNIPNGGVIFSEGESWREQRRTAVHILRDFGMGKGLMEDQVHQSMMEVMQHLDSIEDKSRVDFRWPIQILVANVINNVLFGYTYPYESCKRLMDFANKLNDQLEAMRKNICVFLIMQLPWLEKMPLIGWYGCGQYRANCDRLREHIVEDMKRCEETFRPDEEASDCFVHEYMKRGQRNTALTRDQMANVCTDFFLAGMETTSTTLRWTVLHLANNQRVQDKIRSEIHAVVGKERVPTMADRASLPYTNAASHEAQRIANILPLNVMHRTTCDTVVDRKHSIPGDTIVMAQIYNVMSRSSVFEKPAEFAPDRFLMPDGKTPNKETMEQLIPFSMGKRQCAGEGLARMELFLGLACLLQKYKILPPKEGELDLTPIEASILLPKTNLLQLVPA